MIPILPKTTLNQELKWFRALLHLLHIRWQWWWNSDRGMAGVKGYHTATDFTAIEGTVDQWLLADGRIVTSNEIEVIGDVTDMTGYKANAFESYRAETMQRAVTLYRNSPAGQKPVLPDPPQTWVLYDANNPTDPPELPKEPMR